MELWIRSQDRYTLIKSSKIYVFGNTICDGSKEKIKLAEYKTIERALEVLDDIQNLINDIADNKIVGCVYEMPKE